jgi:hypothetical protein
VAEVAELKPVLEAFVAVTTHLVSIEAVKLLPLTEHPVPTTSKVTAPVPDPPVVVRANVEAGIAVSVVFEIANVCWFAFAKLKLFVADVIELKPVLAALVAVTTHVATVEEVRLLTLLMEHPVPLTE